MSLFKQIFVTFIWETRRFTKQIQSLNIKLFVLYLLQIISLVRYLKRLQNKERRECDELSAKALKHRLPFKSWDFLLE